MLLCDSSPLLLKSLLQFKSCLLTVTLVCPSQVQQSSTGGQGGNNFLAVDMANQHSSLFPFHTSSEFSPIPEEKVGLNSSQFRWNERNAAFGLELLLKELSSWCYLWKVCELLFLPRSLADWYEIYFTLLLKKKFWGEGRET